MAKYTLYIGTYSKGPGNGLFRGEFDNTGGALSITGSLDIENPSYLQVKGDILYGVSEISSFNYKNGGALFSVSAEDLRLIDMYSTHGRHPCHLYIQDRFIFVSNYSEGSLSIFETEADRIQPSIQSIHHFGKGKRQDRQESSHVHYAAMTPDSKYLAVCDLGMDIVFLYPYSAGNGLSTTAIKIICPPGSGPRHLTFSNCGKYIYILTELNNTILTCRYNDSDVKLLHEISVLPPDFKGRSTCAAIHLSPDGAYLAASNRGHDSIAVFKTGDEGRLILHTHVMTGKEPRDFRFSPCGQWLLSANQNNDSITVYKIENAVFKEINKVSLPKPVCIIFKE